MADKYVFYFFFKVAPPFENHTWIMNAEIHRPDDNAEGVLVALGTMNGGFSFYIKDSRLVFDISISTGKCTVRAHFLRKGKRATITLSIDGKECGSIPIPFILKKSQLKHIALLYKRLL